MNRREFLNAAAVTAGATVRSWAANDKVNVAVVGVGGRGTSHVNDYTRRQDANLVAVCDVNTAQTERAVQAYYSKRNTKPKVYADMRKLYDDKDVDAVSIATPNHWHALATIWACQAGKDVYVEKPVSYNLFEGEQMVAAARNTTGWCRAACSGAASRTRSAPSNCCARAPSGRSIHGQGLCYKRRQSIGHKPDTPCLPAWIGTCSSGPAPMRAVQREPFTLQLALVLGHGQWRHRQSGHSRNGYARAGVSTRVSIRKRGIDGRQVRL